jgi:putative ABC transport system permease protein
MEVERHTRFMLGFDPLNVKNGDDLFYGGTHLYADREFLHVFTFPLIAGNKTTALKDPFSIVISASKAHSYFSNSVNKDYDALLGKTLYIGLDKQPYVICEEAEGTYAIETRHRLEAVYFNQA